MVIAHNFMPAVLYLRVNRSAGIILLTHDKPVLRLMLPRGNRIICILYHAYQRVGRPLIGIIDRVSVHEINLLLFHSTSNCVRWMLTTLIDYSDPYKMNVQFDKKFIIMC